MVICESDLRRMVVAGGELTIRIAPDDVVTPAAWDFLREHGFTVLPGESATPTKPAGTAARFVDLSGRSYADKPEHMTHLAGNVLVGKDCPRIRFRGRLDSLQAEMLKAQTVALEDGRGEIVRDLDEALAYVRHILACEVKGEPFSLKTLLGMDAATLRLVSHNPKRYFGDGHFVPEASMGKCLVALNAVRTSARETELACVGAFCDRDGACSRPDLIQALNRLSSAVYIMMCRERGGQYGDCDHGKRE